MKTALGCGILFSVGEWRSLEAHLHGVQGAAGSNPVSPTTTTAVRNAVCQRINAKDSAARVELGGSSGLIGRKASAFVCPVCRNETSLSHRRTVQTYGGVAVSVHDEAVSENAFALLDDSERLAGRHHRDRLLPVGGAHPAVDDNAGVVFDDTFARLTAGCAKRNPQSR